MQHRFMAPDDAAQMGRLPESELAMADGEDNQVPDRFRVFA